MECPICEQRQRHFICDSCLKQHISDYRIQRTHLTADRDKYIAAAQKSLETVVEPLRLRRADVKSREERVREIWEGLEAVRKDNERVRGEIQVLREKLAARRRNLAVATSTLTPTSSTNSTPIARSPPSRNSISPPGPGIGVRPPQPASRRSSSGTPSSRPSISPLSMRHMSSTPPRSNPLPIPGAFPLPPPPPSPTNGQGQDLSGAVAEAQYALNQLSDTISKARSGLVQELVEVFSVVEVGGRPPVGGKAGTKGEWTIGGLVLPVPGDMRRYPPDHINAVLTHTIHFVSLLAFYLGVKLPFEVVWSRSGTPPGSSGSASDSQSHSVTRDGLLGVGTPWIGAIRGPENGGWARWSTKHPLHVSSSPAPSSSSSSSSKSSSNTSSPHPSSSTSPTSSLSPPPNPSTSTPPSSTSASGTSFTTALSMFLYNILYLAHTQSISIPLAQAGEILPNLWAVCCSTDLGRWSHATRPLLGGGGVPEFKLEFGQLVQAMVVSPNARVGAKVRGKPGVGAKERPKKIVEEEDGWDLIDMDT
ncbi:hypothetical protein K474DRAFT_1652488 [Panus rudis PR-1116 ss-1]|nr:hypothetical protein K474DRAFT_1652488 [Panus rudis PR-1116 ss-1]